MQSLNACSPTPTRRPTNSASSMPITRRSTRSSPAFVPKSGDITMKAQHSARGPLVICLLTLSACTQAPLSPAPQITLQECQAV
ncbi:Rz1-like lysis system protein LysC, partial [Paraburkholderia bryophila]|uniref:Rz1-like lysis system protein LysC n=1 Tax=Paraburkholderia bryophila TaxID=420952 RepID=UPI003CC5D849